MSAVEMLRAKTRALHERLEAHSYVRALLDENLPLARTQGSFERCWSFTIPPSVFCSRIRPSSCRSSCRTFARREALERDIAQSSSRAFAIEKS
jgi:hypothetical protein